MKMDAVLCKRVTRSVIVELTTIVGLKGYDVALKLGGNKSWKQERIENTYDSRRKGKVQT